MTVSQPVRRARGPRAGGVRVTDGAAVVDRATHRALGMLLVLAESAGEDPARLVQADQLMRRLAITPRHLEPVVRCLRAEGMIDSRRGRNGGYRLATPADRITVLDVVLAMDRGNGSGIGRAPAGGIRYRGAAAPLASLWQLTDQALATVLGGLTVADVLSHRLRPAGEQSSGGDPTRRQCGGPGPAPAH